MTKTKEQLKAEVKVLKAAYEEVLNQYNATQEVINENAAVIKAVRVEFNLRKDVNNQYTIDELDDLIMDTEDGEETGFELSALEEAFNNVKEAVASIETNNTELERISYALSNKNIELQDMKDKVRYYKG